MTIMEALHRIDSIKPNSYTQNEKIQWLSSLDGVIKREIIDTHDCGVTVAFSEYTEDMDLNTELLVGAPYDDIYIFYLESKIDYWNGEIGKYNNSASLFNEAYSAFARYYNRTHMPVGNNFKYFGNHNAKKSTQASSGLIEITIEEG